MLKKKKKTGSFTCRTLNVTKQFVLSRKKEVNHNHYGLRKAIQYITLFTSRQSKQHSSRVRHLIGWFSKQSKRALPVPIPEPSRSDNKENVCRCLCVQCIQVTCGLTTRLRRILNCQCEVPLITSIFTRSPSEMLLTNLSATYEYIGRHALT